MKSNIKQKGFTVGELIIAMGIILFMGSGWFLNIYKLTQLNFEAPYKAETIRVIGVIPPVGIIVGWMSFDD